jgi:SAM-dependent methyltransferase
MTKTLLPEEQHNIEIHENLEYWNNKAILRKVYAGFYDRIKSGLNLQLEGKVVELGSGIGNLKSVVPEAICTDLFDNPWLDQVENAYNLSFADNELSNLVLFDVWHHLQYPGNVLKEFQRVLQPGGRVVIFEPYISIFSRLVYGLMHHEPIGKKKDISWEGPHNLDPEKLNYYAAQGNASTMFYSKKYKDKLTGWKIVRRERLPALDYLLSGGYSKPQMYPDFMHGAFKPVNDLLKLFPQLFATRLMVVLEYDR